MRAFGGFLIFAGFVSAILHYTDYQLRILSWSESMQPALGIGLGVVGCALVGASVALQKNKEAKAVQQLPPPPGYGPAPQPQQYGAPMGQQQMPYGQQPMQQPYPPQQQYPGPQGQQPYAPQPQPYGQPRQPGSFGPQGFGPRR
jgi:hypothetical protein